MMKQQNKNTVKDGLMAMIRDSKTKNQNNSNNKNTNNLPAVSISSDPNVNNTNNNNNSTNTNNNIVWYLNVYYSYRDYPIKELALKYKKSELKGVYGQLMRKLFTNLQLRIIKHNRDGTNDEDGGVFVGDNEKASGGYGRQYPNDSNYGQMRNNERESKEINDGSDVNANESKNGMQDSGYQSQEQSQSESEGYADSRSGSQSSLMHKQLMGSSGSEFSSSQLGSERIRNRQQSDNDNSNSESSIITGSINNSQSCSGVSSSSHPDSNITSSQNNTSNSFSHRLLNQSQPSSSLSSLQAKQQQVVSSSQDKIQSMSLLKSQSQIQQIKQSMHKIPASFVNRKSVKKINKLEQQQQKQKQTQINKKNNFNDANITAFLAQQQQQQSSNMEIFYELMIKMIPLTLRRITVEIGQSSQKSSSQKNGRSLRRFQIITENEHQQDQVDYGEESQQSSNSQDEELMDGYQQEGQQRGKDYHESQNGGNDYGEKDSFSINNNNNNINNLLNKDSPLSKKIDPQRYRYVYSYVESITSNSSYNRRSSGHRHSNKFNIRNSLYQYKNTKAISKGGIQGQNVNDGQETQHAAQNDSSSSVNDNQQQQQSHQQQNMQFSLCDIVYPQTVEEMKFYVLEYCVNTKVVFGNVSGKQFQTNSEKKEKQTLSNQRNNSNNKNNVIEGSSQSSISSGSFVVGEQRKQQRQLNKSQDQQQRNQSQQPKVTSTHDLLTGYFNSVKNSNKNKNQKLPSKYYQKQKINQNHHSAKASTTSQIQSLITTYAKTNIRQFNKFLNYFMNKTQKSSAVVNVIGLDAITESICQMALGQQARNNGIKTQVGLGNLKKLPSFSNLFSQQNHNILLTTWVDLVMYTADQHTLLDIVQRLNNDGNYYMESTVGESSQQGYSSKDTNDKNSDKDINTLANKQRPWTPSVVKHSKTGDIGSSSSSHLPFVTRINDSQQPNSHSINPTHIPNTSLPQLQSQQSPQLFRSKMLSLLNFMILNTTKNILLQSLTKGNFLSIVMVEILANRHDHRKLKQFELRPFVEGEVWKGKGEQCRDQFMARENNNHQKYSDNQSKYILQTPKSTPYDQAITVYDLTYNRQLWLKQSLTLIQNKWKKVVQIIFQQQVKNKNIYWQLIFEKCVRLVNRQLSLLTVLVFGLMEVVENLGAEIERCGKVRMSGNGHGNNNNINGKNDKNDENKTKKNIKTKNKTTTTNKTTNQQQKYQQNQQYKQFLLVQKYQRVKSIIEFIIKDLIGNQDVFAQSHSEGPATVLVTEISDNILDSSFSNNRSKNTNNKPNPPKPRTRFTHIFSKLINRQQHSKQLIKWQQLMKENILIIQSYISNLQIVNKIFNRNAYYVGCWMIGFDSETRKLIRKVEGYNLPIFFQRFYAKIPRQWAELNYEDVGDATDQSVGHKLRTQESSLQSPKSFDDKEITQNNNSRRWGFIGPTRQRISAIKKKKELSVIEKQVLILNYIIKCELQLYESYNKSHVTLCRQVSTTMTTIVTSNMPSTYGNANNVYFNTNYPYLLEDTNIEKLLLFNYKTITPSNSSNTNKNNNKDPIISNRLFVKRSDKINKTVKPLSNFAPSNMKSSYGMARLTPRINAHSRQQGTSQLFNKKPHVGVGSTSPTTNHYSNRFNKNNRHQQQNPSSVIQYQIDVSLLQTMNYTEQQIELLYELSRHLRCVNEINFEYEYYYWTATRMNGKRGYQQVTTAESTDGGKQETRGYQNQQDLQQKVSISNEGSDSNQYKPVYHQRKMLTEKQYRKEKTKNLLNTQELYKEFQHINEIMTVTRPQFLYHYNNNFYYNNNKKSSRNVYTMVQEDNYGTSNKQISQQQKQQEKQLYRQKIMEFNSRIRMHNESLVLIVNAGLEAKNYWKAVSANVFTEDNDVQVNEGLANQPINSKGGNELHTGNNNNNNKAQGHQQINATSKNITNNNNNNNNQQPHGSQYQQSLQQKFFYNKILQKLQEYINHYKEISSLMNYNLGESSGWMSSENYHNDTVVGLGSNQEKVVRNNYEAHNDNKMNVVQFYQQNHLKQNYNQITNNNTDNPTNSPSYQRRLNVKKPSILQTIQQKNKQKVRVYTLLQGLISKNQSIKRNRFQIAAEIYAYSEKILLLNCYMASFYIERKVYLQIVSQDQLTKQKYSKIKIIGKEYFQKIKDYSVEIYEDKEITEGNLKNVELVYEKKVLILLVSLMELLYYGNEQANTLVGKWKSCSLTMRAKDKKLGTVRVLGQKLFERGYKNHPFKINKKTLAKYVTILKKYLKYRLRKNTSTILSKQGINNLQNIPTSNTNPHTTPDYLTISKLFSQMFEFSQSTSSTNTQIFDQQKFISMLRKLRDQENDEHFLKFFISIIEKQTLYLDDEFNTEQQKVHCLKKKLNYLILREVYFYLHYDVDCLEQKSAYSKKNYEMYENRMLDFYQEIIKKNYDDFVTKKEQQLKKRSIFLQNYLLKYEEQPVISSIEKSLNKLIVCVFNQILLIYTQDIKMEIRKKAERPESTGLNTGQQQLPNSNNTLTKNYQLLHTTYLSSTFFQRKKVFVENNNKKLPNQKEQQKPQQILRQEKNPKKITQEGFQQSSQLKSEVFKFKDNDKNDGRQEGCNKDGQKNERNNNIPGLKEQSFLKALLAMSKVNNSSKQQNTTQQKYQNIGSNSVDKQKLSQDFNKNSTFKVFTLQSMNLHEAITIYQSIKSFTFTSLQSHYTKLKQQFTNVKSLKRQDLTEMEINMLQTNEQSIVSLLKKQIVENINQIKFQLVSKNLISRIQKLYINLDVRHKVFQSFKDKILSYEMQKAKIYHQYMDYIRGLKLDVYSHIANQDSLPYIKILNAIKAYRLKVKKEELQNKVRQQFGKNLKKWNQGIQQDLMNYHQWLIQEEKHWQKTKYLIAKQKQSYLVIYDSIRKQLKRQFKKKDLQEQQKLKRSSQNLKRTLQLTFSDPKNIQKSYKQLKKVTSSKKNLFILNNKTTIPNKSYENGKVDQNYQTNSKPTPINLMLPQSPQNLFMAEKKQRVSVEIKKSNSLHNMNHRSFSKYSIHESKNLQRPKTSMQSEHQFKLQTSTVKSKSRGINRASTAVTRQKSMDLQASQFRGIKMKYISRSTQKQPNADSFYKQDEKYFKKSIYMPEYNNERIISGHIFKKNEQISSKQIDISGTKSKKLIKQARVINSAMPQRKGILKNF